MKQKNIERIEKLESLLPISRDPIAEDLCNFIFMTIRDDRERCKYYGKPFIFLDDQECLILAEQITDQIFLFYDVTKKAYNNGK